MTFLRLSAARPRTLFRAPFGAPFKAPCPGTCMAMPPILRVSGSKSPSPRATFPPATLARGPPGESSRRTGNRRRHGSGPAGFNYHNYNPMRPTIYLALCLVFSHWQLRCTRVCIWLLFCCRACPRSKPFELNSADLPSYDRRTCPRSRRPVVLDTSRSPAITLHGVVSSANIEVVPQPDGSQLSLWASKRVRVLPLCSATIHESLYHLSHSSFCPTHRLLEPAPREAFHDHGELISSHLSGRLRDSLTSASSHA